MRWTSALSQRSNTGQALREVSSAVTAGLAEAPADLLLVFATPHHAPGLEPAMTLLRRDFPGARVVGAVGSSVAGAGREVEDGPALSVVAAHLPDVEIRPFRVPAGAPDAVDVRAVPSTSADAPMILWLADPRSCPVEAWLDALSRHLPGASVFGGLASGPRQAVQLICDESVVTDGAVGVMLWGDIDVEVVVAQGCRPLGEPFIVTEGGGPILRTLDGRPALTVMREVLAALPQRSRAAFERAPLVGVATIRSGLTGGDVLVRPVIGADHEALAVAVGHDVVPGDLVQLQLRDRASAAADMHRMLDHAARSGPAAGALLFSCLGRGKGLFGVADHDTGLVRSKLEVDAVGGMFCSGEIGPVHGRAWMHGFTSVVALFRPAEWN